MRPIVALLAVLVALPLFGAVHFSPEMPLGSLQYGPTPASEAQVATNGSVYAATWTDTRAIARMAYVTRFRADGAMLDPAGIAIPGSSQSGAIVWTGQTFLIAYIDDRRIAM